MVQKPLLYAALYPHLLLTQFRKLTSEEAWEKDATKIHGIVACAKLLARAHHFKVRFFLVMECSVRYPVQH
jgi:hypothetical protein